MNNKLFYAISAAIIIAAIIYLLNAKTNKKMLKAATDALNLNSTQQYSVNAINKAFEKYGDGDANKLAYILATAYHESHLKPIREIKGSPGSALWNIQQKYWPSGYYGRGFVQITWEGNYKKLGDAIGVNLVRHPDKALQTSVAAKIIVVGMMRGLFTGKKLSDFINENGADFYAARGTVGAKIVLGQDTAQMIENNAIKILKEYQKNQA
jgi:putative chitinase